MLGRRMGDLLSGTLFEIAQFEMPHTRSGWYVQSNTSVDFTTGALWLSSDCDNRKAKRKAELKPHPPPNPVRAKKAPPVTTMHKLETRP
jgi:hypothetical protein